GGTMVAGSCDWHSRKLRDWLLLLLRFAITRELADRSAALAAADELDALGLRWRPGDPSFFLRTSREVCGAILSAPVGTNNTVLRNHIARIDDPRLKRAFRVVVGPAETSLRAPPGTKASLRHDLWKGLE